MMTTDDDSKATTPPKVMGDWNRRAAAPYHRKYRQRRKNKNENITTSNAIKGALAIDVETTTRTTVVAGSLNANAPSLTPFSQRQQQKQQHDPGEEKTRPNSGRSTLVQSKTPETKTTTGIFDDGRFYPSNLKSVSFWIEKGDQAFKMKKYDDAREAYEKAWRLLHIAMTIGRGDAEDEEEAENTKEKCRKELSIVLTKLGECHAVGKRWDLASGYAKMALENDATNQDALYLRAKAQYYDKELWYALVTARSMAPDDERGIKLVKTIQSFLLSVIDKNRDLLQRIIDSYRLRAQTTNACNVSIPTKFARTTFTG
jgi:tetratricopeptide (TPR) repeat protein